MRSPHDVVSLQRTVGNSATVQALADAQQEAEAPAPPADRGARLNLIDHEQQELYSGDHHRLAEYVRHLQATDRPDVFRLLLKRLRRKDQDEQADRLEKEWQDPPPGEQRAAVPHELHFAWLGKAPGKNVLKNLDKWRKNAQDSDWTLNLWTEPSDPDWHTELAQSFKGHLRIRSDSAEIVSRVGGAENAELYEKAKAHGAYNMATDILRYCVLKEHGGVYLDVDIAPGQVRLADAPKMQAHTGEAPLFAPTLRDQKSVHSALERPKPKGVKRLPGMIGIKPKLTPEDLQEAASNRYAKGLLNNNFIVARDQSAFMQLLLDQIPKRMEDLQKTIGAQNPVDLKEMAPHISGPDLVLKELRTFAREHLRVGLSDPINGKQHAVLHPEEYQEIVDLDTLEFWKKLKWVTAQSENQLDRRASRLKQLLQGLAKYLPGL